jgi:transcriptional regulator with XRE-family HTH domain
MTKEELKTRQLLAGVTNKQLAEELKVGKQTITNWRRKGVPSYQASKAQGALKRIEGRQMTRGVILHPDLTITLEAGHINDLEVTSVCSVEGLPERTPGIYFIVPLLAKIARPDRHDLIALHENTYIR